MPDTKDEILAWTLDVDPRSSEGVYDPYTEYATLLRVGRVPVPHDVAPADPRGNVHAQGLPCRKHLARHLLAMVREPVLKTLLDCLAWTEDGVSVCIQQPGR